MPFDGKGGHNFAYELGDLRENPFSFRFHFRTAAVEQHVLGKGNRYALLIDTHLNALVEALALEVVFEVLRNLFDRRRTLFRFPGILPRQSAERPRISLYGRPSGHYSQSALERLNHLFKLLNID